MVKPKYRDASGNWIQFAPSMEEFNALNAKAWTRDNQNIKGSSTTTTASWVASGVAALPYKKSITISGLTANDFVFVNFNNATYGIAQAAGISNVESTTNTLILYAKKVPTASVTFDYSIIKG